MRLSKLFIAVFSYRDITIRKDLPRVVIDSMTMLGAVLAILVTAVGFTGWMIQAEIPTLLIAFNIFLVLIGMFTDGVTAIIVVVPLILPLAYAYDVDPYHLAVIFLLNLEFGFLIPPVGMNLFISSIRFGKSVAFVCRSVLPSLGVLTVTLGIVTYVPWISTDLPSFIKVEEEGVSLGGGYIRLKPDEGEEGAAGTGAEEPMPEDDLDEAILDAGIDAGVDDGPKAGAGGAEAEGAPKGEGPAPKDAPPAKAAPKQGEKQKNKRAGSD